ncbi:MAG: DUF2605 domain-containing protein [Synechococcales bacterium]|nr:DUF2605 domain-containing protein [Synechococcales bacterium]
MNGSNPSRSDLLQAVLQPLLDDFRYWFEQSRSLLESKDLPNLTNEAQADLLARVIQAQQEVDVANALFKATEGQAGVDMPVVQQWHDLVNECWQVAMQYRLRLERGQDS